MTHGINLSKVQCPKIQNESEYMNKIPHASTIGSIMYVMLCTRLDMLYALSMTNRYQLDLGECHQTVIKNILNYLRRTKDAFLIYGGEEKLVVKGNMNASFQSNKDDSRSQLSYVFYLNDNAINWKSSKQETMANSTIETKYIVVFDVAKKVVWIKKFIIELGVVPNIVNPVDLYYDNNGAIAKVKKPRFHQ